MSRHNRERREERRRRAADALPPVTEGRQSLNDPDFVPVLEYDVVSWCPTPDGSGPSTAVALILRGPVANPGVTGPATVTMQVRLKSARAVDELIAALERHRDDVWPGG